MYVLQSRASGIRLGIMGHFYDKVGQLLQSEATFVTKQGRYYKVGQLQYRNQKRKTPEDNGFWQSTPGFSPDLYAC